MGALLAGRVHAVLTTPLHTTFVTAAQEHMQVDIGGVPGDRHFGVTCLAGVREPMYERGTRIFNRRQLTVVSTEELMLIARRLGIDQLRPEWIGANIVTSGIAGLTQTSPGSRFVFSGGSAIVCEGENLPCTTAGAQVAAAHPDRPDLRSGFVKAAMGLRGVVAIVERPGRIQRGESVQLLPY